MYGQKGGKNHINFRKWKIKMENENLKSENGGWCYQTVYKKIEKDFFDFSICEVYLDANGKLISWTEDSNIAAGGYSEE